MRSAKHTPVAILSLILASALAVLIIGARFAREERTINIEQDRAALSSFATRLIGEIGKFNSLYQSHLLDIRDQITPDCSNIEISSICRDIVGVEQATIFFKDDPPVHLDLRGEDRSTPLPLPHRSGEQSTDDGIIVDVEKIENAEPGADFQWINQPNHPPHFAAKLKNKTTLVLRINPAQAAAATDEGLADWLPNAFAPIKVAEIPTAIHNPSGEIIASTENADYGETPNVLLPIPSTFGEWTISSWDLKETVTYYNQPVLIGSASLAIILAIAGFFGFTQQQLAFRLAEQRASFVNRVSHELRTPMTNILLNIDLLNDSLSEDDKPRTNRLSLIREEASRLSRLIENVLTFSRREKSKNSVEEARQSLHIIPCDVNQVIDSVLSQFSPTLTRNNLVVQRSEPDATTFALADPDAFSQIISNLISNVEKYATSGGKFDITVDATVANNVVTISITDFGPGIPESEASRIFHPFVRLSDATTDGVSGTGLGLAIARDLAESMNGKLTVESGNKTEHEGSRFILTLPSSANNIVSMAS